MVPLVERSLVVRVSESNMALQSRNSIYIFAPSWNHGWYCIPDQITSPSPFVDKSSKDSYTLAGIEVVGRPNEGAVIGKLKVGYVDRVPRRSVI